MNPLEELALSVSLVFVASLLFVNAIEYLAERLRWSSSFTGSIVTPLFTSMPELFIFLIAIIGYSGARGHEIGLGTIFGEPFMTSTLSYFLLMLALLGAVLAGKTVPRRLSVARETQVPYAFIALLLPWLIVPGLIHSSALQYAMGSSYLFLYVVYIVLSRRSNIRIHEEPVELPYFVRLLNRPVFSVIQVAIAAVILFIGSIELIVSITAISGTRPSDALSFSIILVPIATAIPETIAGMIWAFKGKNTLAVGSLVGENVLYATFYPGLALLLVPWIINVSVVISVAGTALASAMYFFFVRKGSLPVYILPVGFILYIAFVLSIHA